MYNNFMCKKTINLDISTLDEFEEKTFVKYSWKNFTEKVSEMTNDILSEQNYFINEFKWEYIEEIKKEINKWVSVQSIININEIISIFLNKYFNINNFNFWVDYFNQLKDQNKETFLDFFEEVFLKEFYTFILNINSFNIPIVSTDNKEWWLFNWTLFWYLENWKINFKFEYETSKDIYKQSFQNSEINLLIEEKDEDIYEKKLLNEIDFLDEISNTFHKFITNLIENKNTQFIILRNLSLNKDYLDIKFFINKNKKDIDENKINSLYITYFRWLIKFIWDNRNTWTFDDFNKFFNSNNNLNKDDLELYYKIWKTNIFYTRMIQEFDHITDFLIEDLENELSVKNYINLIPILPDKDNDNNVDSKDLLSENKIDIYKKDFEKIIYVLYKNRDINIWITLNNNWLLDSQENIYFYIDDNKEKLIKSKKWKIIYDFIFWISNNMLNITFKEYLEKNKIPYISLFDFPKLFWDIISKL